MKNSNSKIVAIAAALNISIQSAYRQCRKLDINEEAPIKKRERKPVLKDMLHNSIRTIIASDNALTEKALTERLPANIQTSRSTIFREIKKLGYTRKRLKLIVSARNFERVFSKRYIFGLALSSVADNQLVFIDKTGFNFHYSSHYSYSPALTNA
ncbi:hypothetical protein CDIK_2889 [Cucumispora dikerogammari]|nr:hypothetical protein CDIK_2889 [Cucumispora dikerogammari]